MQGPEGAPRQHKPENTLVKALARAFRWKRMLVSGEFSTIAVLSFQRRHPFGHLAGDARTLAANDLSLPDPVIQGLGRAPDLR